MLSCAQKATYTPPPDTIVQYIIQEKPCPQPEKVPETNSCQQNGAEEKKPDPITPEYRALLDTLAWAEGTDCHYNMMMGRMLFTNYSAHPIETGEMPAKGIPFTQKRRYKGRTYRVVNYSTAAGRFQFLYRTYLKLKNEAGLFQTGFNPEEQRKAAIYLLKEKGGVTEEILQKAIETGDFMEVWNRLSWEWASLPCDEAKKPRRERKICYKDRGRYRQFTYPDKDLQRIFFIYYDIHKKQDN